VKCYPVFDRDERTKLMALKVCTQDGSFEINGPILISLKDGHQVRLYESSHGGIAVSNNTVHPVQEVKDGTVVFGRKDNDRVRKSHLCVKRWDRVAKY